MSASDKTHRFVMIGAGGVGSWLARGLAMSLDFRHPFSTLIIVDGDTFEPKNKERQLFSAIGNKAEVLAADVQQQVESTVIIPIPSYVVEEAVELDDDAEEDRAGVVAASELLQEGDVVFAVVDNFKARKTIFDAASKIANIDVITGGNDDRLFMTCYHYQRRDNKDVTLHPGRIHPEYNDPPDRNPGEMSCQERAELEGGTQFLASNLGAAALIMCKVQSVIYEQREATEHAEWYFDFDDGGALAHARSAEPIEAKEKELANG